MSSPADTMLLHLFQNQLLDPTQLAGIRSWATERAADPAAAVRELTNRGWLTRSRPARSPRGKPAT